MPNHPVDNRCWLQHRYYFFIAAVIALALLLVAGTLILMILSGLDEQSFQEQEFQQSATVFLRGLENVFQRWNSRLQQLRTVAELSYSKPQEEATYSQFEQPLTLHQWDVFLKGVINEFMNSTTFTGWIGKVLLQDRQKFEDFGNSLDPKRNFSLLEIRDGEIFKAGVRPVYFPFVYWWPYTTVIDGLLDLSSEARRKKMLEIALREDKAILSEPVQFAKSPGGGVYLVLPVFDLSMFPSMTDRKVSLVCSPDLPEPLVCDALLGFVAILIKYDEAVAAAAALSLRNTHVTVTDLEENEVVTEYEPCGSPSSDDLQLSDVISINNRKWQIDMRLCESEVRVYSKFKWFIFVCAVALFMLIVLSLFLLKKNTEKSLASHRAFRNAEAEREIEERNRLLAEEERIGADAARVRAEEISNAKARFLNNMNRELRTPLSGVVGTIDILQNSLPKEVLSKYAEDFETISNCAEVLLSTVNDILDINKLMAGKLKLHYNYFYIRDVISSCISPIRVAAAKKNISITMKFSRRLNLSLSDQARLSQIVLNYLSNAVKFTQENGRIIITLTWGEMEEQPVRSLLSTSGDIGISDGDLMDLQNICECQRKAILEKDGVESHREQMTLCVEDSGIGIAGDKIGNLFQPFEQADASVTRVYGGTGLGLSICRQLAQLLGGSVWVESTIGVGSKFYLSLPMDVVEDKHVDTLISLKEGLGNSRNKQLKVIASLSENLTLKQKRCDMYEEHVLPQRTSSESMSSNRAITVEGSLSISGESSQEELEKRDGKKVDAHPPSSQSSKSNEDAESRRTPETPTTARKRRKKQIQFPGKTVLIVEDNLLNQKIFTKYLISAGVDVEVADNGELGVEEANRKKYDLIFMDCHMPVMDGYLATQNITEDEECVNKSTPIIALTADVEASNKKRCEECGMVDYLTKPLQSATLYDVMSKYFSSV